MSEVVNTVLSIAILAGLTFGILAVFPRKRASLVPATMIVLVILTVLNVLGSALVGPLDLRPMLILTPVVLALVATWYFWKIKAREVS